MTHKAAFMTYDARSFRVSAGVNLGDAMARVDTIEPADAYALDSRHTRLRMVVARGPEGDLRVAEGSLAGTPGAPVNLVGSVSMMSPEDLSTFDLALLSTPGPNGAETFLVSQTSLSAHQDYVVVASSPSASNARAIMRQLTSASFASGTRILTGARSFCPVDDLVIGDMVQTRDHGVQPIRWIGRQLVRAEGQFAPIRIEKGAVQNHDTLCLSPSHRLFVFQRKDTLGAGRAEVLVAAEALVNGVTVTKTEGGHVEYVQLLFDQHEILYAEGVAVESGFAGQLFADADDPGAQPLRQAHDAVTASLTSQYERFAFPTLDRTVISAEALVATSRGE